MNTKAGLDGVIAGESHICLIDGQNQRLSYRGYNVADLVKYSDFEETAYLLIHGSLPNKTQYDAFVREIRSHYALPDAVKEMIRNMPKHIHTMDALRTAVSALAAYTPAHADAYDTTSDQSKSLILLAQTPAIIAEFYRAKANMPSISPSPDLSIAGNFLYLINGNIPSAEDIRSFDACLILHADHGFNASTFTARVIAGTYSDMYSAVVGAIGALKGPLHGGANEAVKKMLLEIPSANDAAAYVRNALENGQKISGFGHRVYRSCEDPRATILRQISKELSEKANTMHWYDTSIAVYDAMMAIGTEKGKPLYPNVDFFSASVYTLLGVPDELFTPVFAMSRMAGWCAHTIEQHSNNRLIRPQEEYIGPAGLVFVNIEDR